MIIPPLSLHRREKKKKEKKKEDDSSIFFSLGLLCSYYYITPMYISVQVKLYIKNIKIIV